MAISEGRKRGKRRCLIVTPGRALPGNLSANDRRQIERFETFLRLVGEAKRAGVPQREAAAAIYPDVFDDGEAVRS